MNEKLAGHICLIRSKNILPCLYFIQKWENNSQMVISEVTNYSGIVQALLDMRFADTKIKLI